ncbi:hypothetical protein [Pelagicoccus sp. SDUM812003]|uniref:hypothetical protein n=1 Tax=Pelagicoccus sp. SDUM812003 TaxID=3041267 RepID=UPI00280DFEAA|nr:hypothetical protein [Pelagicoccus sp. SDUM812003]MDQ8201808.1 hypothetical protein [Pelagicoccus sp. SDUM812003]
MPSASQNHRTAPWPFTGIALSWALAGGIHLLTFAWILPISWEGILYGATLALLLTRPNSLSRFLAFLASTALVLALNYDKASNHLVLEFWIAVSVLVALLMSCIHPARRASCQLSAFERIAPLVRGQYLLAFSFAAFSKLNTDFLDPEWSCAALFAEQAARFLRLDSKSFGLFALDRPSLQYAVIYLTLACEFAIPLLLLLRTTRRDGIYLALGFHFALGFVPILGIGSYSALSFTLLLFFFPKEALTRLDANLRKIFRFIARSSASARLLPFAFVLLLASLVYAQHRSFHPAASPVALLAWLLVFLPLLGIAIVSLHKAPLPKAKSLKGSIGDLIPRPKRLLALHLPIFALGILPYLGLQTQGSFTMFSNLRVLGDRPNHLVASSAMHISPPILIDVLSSNHPDLSSYPNSDRRITSHELRRKVASTEKDFYVLCEFDGRIELIGRFEGELTPHPFLEPLPIFPNRWIRFRDVSTSDSCPCVW